MKKFLFSNNPALTYFDIQFEQENIRRERQRAGVLLFFFTISFLSYALFAKTVYQLNYLNGHEGVPQIIFLYLAFMTFYELTVWLSMKYLLKVMNKMPLVAKFGNATLEITLLTLVMYFAGQEYNHPILIVLSPLVYIYFIFIILSTLRLSFAVSLWTGLLAGLEYFFLSYHLIESGTIVSEHDIYTKQMFSYLLKTFSLVFGGLSAGYVATQIRKSIQLSIERMETQEHIVEMFGQQVSPEVAQVMLEQNGILKAKHQKVSIMFLDIRNFTLYADKHTAEEVMDYQNAFFEVVVNTVNEYNGIVNQFLGDGCMVTFGAPINLENPSENAVKAGLAIIEKILKMNELGTIPNTGVGIGIHTGDAVVGNIGTDSRQQYNITGNVVIQAARIEQLNKKYQSQLLISQEVMDEISAIPIDTKQVGSVKLKGMENEMFLWKLA
ncbi:adenylate/guanylate cyclase domain-containing protein [Arcicella aquatica]|uniref:Adenylate/guanylate cyclase domain-containing protein n=1 Tax=Arcicella aquatica TaxID=217141 RepID=A0ABU5QR69_9BACT|nr:adenylate/guanylate cyclase domain-containing protein [Arcicella aquatica]MEA5259319.1 adenylate/guanylate cyclase domain-containing protein [Arcicella aquatica]